MYSEDLMKMTEELLNPIVTLKKDFDVYHKGMKAYIFKALSNEKNDEITFYLDFCHNKEIKEKKLQRITKIVEYKTKELEYLDIQAIDNSYLDLKINYIKTKSPLRYIDWVQEELSKMKALYE